MGPRTGPMIPALVAALALAGSTAAQPSPSWPNTPAMRREAISQVEALNAELLSHDSATLTLERWCASHALASPAKVVAERVRGDDKPLSSAQRELLRLGPSEPVRYRRVRLRCGAHVLSEADNWYRPERLTPEMNRLLETTDTPFGKVVQPLGFHRRTLEATDLLATTPADPRPSAALRLPAAVLQHRAVLELPDGTPFSEVVETYTDQVLDFQPRPFR